MDSNVCCELWRCKVWQSGMAWREGTSNKAGGLETQKTSRAMCMDEEVDQTNLMPRWTTTQHLY